jgi:triosephosphate isomerase
MPQRPRLIVGNWKMHKTIPEATAFVDRLADLLHRETEVGTGGASAGPPPVIILLAPPFTALSAVAAAIRSHPFVLSGQDLHWEPQGAFTGEISASMLRDAGCRYVIVGHSERRQWFGETDAVVQKKSAAALRHGLRPILCIGETSDQRRSGQTEQVLSVQLAEGLAAVGKEHVGEVVIAYEPVWAIGSGHPATPAQAGEAHRHIRARIRDLWGQDAAGQAPILYGGSVTPDNIAELLATPEIDGALVGSACLDPVQFARILTIARAV